MSNLVLKVLALDTSVRTQSVARLEGDRVVVMVGWSGERGHADHVLGLVERAMDLHSTGVRADLTAEMDVIAVSRGPGSMTGLRVGIGTARGIAMGAHKPLVGVSTLQAVAACVGGGWPVLALIDAGRGEVFGGLYGAGEVPIPLGEERIAPPQSFADAVRGRRVRLAGTGALRYHGLFPDADWSPAPGEDFLAPGVGRIAAALVRRDSAPGHPRSDLEASPRYLRREPAPVRFEE